MKAKLLFSLIVIIVLSCNVVGCTKSTPPTYTPKYTTDRAIYIAQSQYPVAFQRQSLGRDASGISRYQTIQTPTIITATYIDTAVWKVVITCPDRYYLVQYNSGISSKTLYFYEGDSKLYNSYNSYNKTLQ